MQPRGGHLARREQTGQSRGPHAVGAHAPDAVVRRGADRDPILRDVEAVIAARAGDAGEATRNAAAVEVVEVQEDARHVGPLQMAHDRPRDDVARRQLGAFVVFGEEAAALVVHDPGPLATDRLGDEQARHAGEVERRGMELDELQILQRGAGPMGRRHAIAGRAGEVAGLPIDLRVSAGAHHDGSRPRWRAGDRATSRAHRGSDRPGP